MKLNTDESPGIATEYGIRSIPTVMIFKNGQKLDTVIGAVPKTTCAAFRCDVPTPGSAHARSVRHRLVSTIDKYL